jgi:S1-C subfamily serine protease
VVIPAAIAWRAAANVLEHGGPRRGYLGIAGQPVRLSDSQRGPEGRENALLVVGVTDGGPAASAGILVGDVVFAFDGHAAESPEDLFDLLGGNSVGQKARLRLLRGGAAADVTVTVGERPSR